MPRYLKQAPWHSPQVSEQVRATVSEMLSAIGRDGEAAIRRYSERLDGWAPESFVVGPRAVEAAGEQLGQALARRRGVARSPACCGSPVGIRACRRFPNSWQRSCATRAARTA